MSLVNGAHIGPKLDVNGTQDTRRLPIKHICMHYHKTSGLYKKYKTNNFDNVTSHICALGGVE